MCDGRPMCVIRDSLKRRFEDNNEFLKKPIDGDDISKRREILDSKTLKIAEEITALFLIDQDGNVYREKLQQRILILSEISAALSEISLDKDEVPLEEISKASSDKVAAKIRNLLREILPDCQLPSS